MSVIESFQDVLFPAKIGYSAKKSIIRNVEIQDFISGKEQRNARKYHSKRRFEIAVAAKSDAELALLADFYEARKGPLIGFRWHDKLDHKSCILNADPNAIDQNIGTYDGQNAVFQLPKKYGDNVDDDQNYIRNISKPKLATTLIAMNAVVLTPADYIVDLLTGKVTILPAAGLAQGDVISAGFEFDVAVRFEQQSLDIDHSAHNQSEIAKISLSVDIN